MVRFGYGMKHPVPLSTYNVCDLVSSTVITVSDFLSVVGEKFFNDYLRIDTKRFPISVK
jgi:hypothetical protein